MPKKMIAILVSVLLALSATASGCGWDVLIADLIGAFVGGGWGALIFSTYVALLVC